MAKYMIVFQYRISGKIMSDVRFLDEFDMMKSLSEYIEFYLHPINIEVYAYSTETGYVRIKR